MPSLYRCTNAGQVLERPVQSRIQEVETEIDFALGRRQWRGYTHDPVGRAGTHTIGAQSKLQRIVGNRIRKRARRVPFVPIERVEFQPEQQAPPTHVANTGISMLQ